MLDHRGHLCPVAIQNVKRHLLSSDKVLFAYGLSVKVGALDKGEVLGGTGVDGTVNMAIFLEDLSGGISEGAFYSDGFRSRNRFQHGQCSPSCCRARPLPSDWSNRL